MNYCIHLKKRKNKPYCNIIKKEIPFSQCRECGNKEYKSKNKENSLFKNKKCTEFTKNSARKSTLKEKSPIKSGTKMQQCNLQQHKAHINKKMRVKSKKLAQLEKNRFSVFTSDDKCFVCGSTYLLTWHEVFAGRNRQNSMEDGFCLRMCLLCHEEKQENTQFNEFWHRKAQLYYEQNIGDRKQFLARYRRSYLK